MPFYILLVLLLLPAMAFVVVPYLRASYKHAPQSSSESETNVELYAARLKELELELETQHIQQSEFDQLKDELGLSLLVDSHLQSSVISDSTPLSTRTHLMLAVSSAMVIAIFSVAMYAKFGAWPEVEIQKAAKILEQENAPPEKLQALIQLLNNRLLDSPRDSNSWYLLGHTHMKQGSFRQSASAFEKLQLLVGTDVNIEISLTQARYMADGGNISETNRQAMQNILRRAPHQPLILEILAIEAFQNRDATAAITYLQQGLAGGLRGERAESFRSGIQRAQEMMREITQEVDMAGTASAVKPGPTGVKSNAGQADISAKIVIQVSIDPALQAAEETAIFVFAREQGGMPMPLAVKRLSVGELPAEIIFTDADAMVKSRLLSQFNSIELVARLSYSGQPSLQPGDVESRVSNVIVTQLEAPIVLRLEP